MKSGAPIPPGQKVPAKLAVFLLNVKNEFAKKKATLERANEVETGEMNFS